MNDAHAHTHARVGQFVLLVASQVSVLYADKFVNLLRIHIQANGVNKTDIFTRPT